MENKFENWQHFLIGLFLALLSWLLYIAYKNHRIYMEDKFGKLEKYQKVEFLKDYMLIVFCALGSIIEIIISIFT